MPHQRNVSLIRVAASLILAAGLVAPGLAVAGQPPTVGAQPNAPTADLTQAHAEGVVLVTYGAGTDESKRAAARRSVSATAARPLSPLAPNAERFELGSGVSVQRAIAILQADPSVLIAEPDYLLTSQDVSNDPYYTGGSLWGMEGDSSPLQTNPYGSAAAEAWQAGYTGSRSVVVGVIDEGIQYSHPDLAANIWTNPGEIAGNGLDDDGNGYVDDVHGWDFFYGDATVYDGDDAHGTHVAGTIGGVGGNGTGVAGVNWQVTIISAKFLGPNGGYTSDAVRAVDYLTDLKVNRGVNLVASSNSWGGGGFSSTLLAAINRGGDAGVLFVAAAGNNGADNDGTARYPTGYQCTNGGTRGWDCVVSVAAISSSGAKASWSNWGSTTVDLGAPGVSIMSTLPTNGYGSYSGTSMATPHVSGAVALCKSMNPSLSAAQIRSAILSSAAPTSSLAGLTVTGGRLDIGAMIPLCAPISAPVSGGPGQSLSATGSAPDRIDLSWTDGAGNEASWEIQQSAAGCTTWSTVGQAGANATSFAVSGLAPDTSYCFRVRATNEYGGGSSSPWSNAAVGRTLAGPPSYDCAGTNYAWIDATAGGSPLALGDDDSVTVALPFEFPFYGGATQAVRVSSNGYLLMGSGNGAAVANVPIPDGTDPNGFVAAFWDDLNPSVAGQVWTRTLGSAPNRQFVAAWVGVARYGVSNSAVTFEVVLDEASGAITLQYLDVEVGRKSYDFGKSATVGIENPAGTDGTLISYNSPSLANGSAWLCTSDGAPPALTITTSSLPDGTTASSYDGTLTAAGGQTPYAWTITSGALPAGLSLDSASGVISGTPSAAGTAAFTVQVQGNDGETSSRGLSIQVADPLAISTNALASGTVGVAYSASLAAGGGKAPYAWSVSGDLPPGLSLDPSSGVISGTPTLDSTWSFTVQVQDAGNPARSDSRLLSITIAPSTSPPPGSFGKLDPVNNQKLTASSAVLSWAASSGATSYEYCVSTSNGTCTDGWISTTSQSAQVNNLATRVNYWWQVRAVNGNGTADADAGSWWKFSVR